MVSEAHFSDLTELKYLNLDYNKNLAFNTSREWIPLFQLRILRLRSCKISDEFPQWIRTQRNLEELVLSNANISGPLPTWLRKMPLIRVIDLSHNNLTGSLTNLPSREHFEQVGFDSRGGILLLQNNLFSGSIRTSLCARKDLSVLDLSRNRLTGEIPKCVSNIEYLTMILFSSNMLSGDISSFLGRLPALLMWLQLNDNNFTGELSQEFAYLTELNVLDLGENKISGTIPEWIGNNLTQLNILRLHKNNFTGRIPQSLCTSSSLKILDLAHNSLTGSIPHCFGDFYGMMSPPWSEDTLSYWNINGNVMQVIKGVDLEYAKTLNIVINMDLSSNKLTGEIPQELTALISLMGLNLSNNHLNRGIPYNIGNMKALISLDLSANHLTGIIPPSMADLNFLTRLNLSHNSLSGQIPTGNQLQTLTDPSIYAGNRDLCGAPLPKNCCNHADRTTATSMAKYKGANNPKKVWFYLDIMSGFATGFWGIIGVLLFKKQWRHKLFMYSEATIDRIQVAVAVRISKMK
ncbi:putative non-specific serine/threonine protein kinase [Tanacetum coccineum]